MATKKCAILQVWMQMKDTNNPSGRIFGGTILSQIDIAAGLAAKQLSPQQNWVTVAMKEVIFKNPVMVEDVLTLYTTITKIGNTSITVAVDVETNRFGNIIPVTSTEVVYVAIDRFGKPERVITSKRRGSQIRKSAPTCKHDD